MKTKSRLRKKLKKFVMNLKLKFLINDDPKLAHQINADGCHLGQNDMAINDARKLLKNKNNRSNLP
jgi:thiamine-phosphate pyrophosphorylase